MDPDGARTAADLVNRASRDELLHAIGTLGEEPRARRVVEAILEARRVAPLRRTCELAELVARVLGASPKRHHPATRTFLGLRMAVNDEAGAIERCLPQLVRLLAKDAAAVVIAFHGGEDRIVKHCFRTAQRAGSVEAVTTRPLTPSGAEVSRNPRARSARIRAVRRTDLAVGPRGDEFDVHAGGGGTG
jgi:16S rRNA (cytosine1402-N4)-methyltransferase